MDVEVPVENLTQEELDDYAPGAFCYLEFAPESVPWVCTRKKGHSGTHVGGWSHGDAGVAWLRLSDEDVHSELVSLAKEMKKV